MSFLTFSTLESSSPLRNLRKHLCPASLAQPGQPAQLRAAQSGSAWLPASLLPLCPASLAQPGQPELSSEQPSLAQPSCQPQPGKLSAWQPGFQSLIVQALAHSSSLKALQYTTLQYIIYYILFAVYYLLYTIYYIVVSM